MAREQKQPEHSLSQVQRKLKAFEGTEQMHDEMLERALEFAANCFSSHTKISDIQKKMLNQLFFEKVLISSKGEKEHHAHAHLNTWTLIFRTTNIAENETIGLRHHAEPVPGYEPDENLASSVNSLTRMCKSTMVRQSRCEKLRIFLTKDPENDTIGVTRLSSESSFWEMHGVEILGMESRTFVLAERIEL